MNDAEFFVAGQAEGLYPFLLALMSTHPDLIQLRRSFDHLVEVQIAVTTAVPLNEKYLDGQAHTVNRFTARLNDLIASKGK